MNKQFLSFLLALSLCVGGIGGASFVVSSQAAGNTAAKSVTSGDTTGGDTTGGNSSTTTPEEPGQVDEVVAEVSDALDAALEAAETDAAAAVEALVADQEAEDIQEAMTKDAAVLEKVAQLEEAYADQKNITVEKKVLDAAEDYLQADDITVVGAAFSAEEGQSINLEIAFPEEQVSLTIETVDSIQLEIKLVCDGADVDTLKMPVAITMPVPKGLPADEKTLAILHYADVNAEPEKVPFTVNDGKVTFTVTHFSIFVFAQVEETAETPSDTPAAKPDDTETPAVKPDSVSAAPAVASIKDRINAAPANSTVVITENGPITLTKSDLEALAAKKTVSLKLEYFYNGKKFSVLIPAGNIVIKDDVFYYGPLFLASIYGSDSGLTSGDGVYTVVKGDALSKIAKVYKTTVQKLMVLNPQIKNADLIRIGQKIKLF